MTAINPQDHIGLARKAARSAARRDKIPVEDTDEFSVAMLGIVAAAQNYKSSRKCKFSTYAHPWIKGAIARLHEVKNRQLSKIQRIGAVDVSVIAATGSNPAREAEMSEEIAELRMQIRALPYEQRLLIGMRLAGMNMREISEVMDVRTKRAQQIELLAMMALRDAMQKKFPRESEF
jgi:RNA polymerase sigma factor (sigma-70 family)